MASYALPDGSARIIGPDLGSQPAWAVAIIVAQYETDQSDIMTDYFATSRGFRVPLAWSRSQRDLFSEMRKAAATFKPTRHLGPGCDVWRPRVVLSCVAPRNNGGSYYKGERSHWHSELYPDGSNPPEFATEADATAFAARAGEPHAISFGGALVTFAWEITRESIEHREKYSMGAGYYLKASGRYSTGWIVRKTSL